VLDHVGARAEDDQGAIAAQRSQMPLDARPVDVLGMHRHEPVAHERLAEQRGVSIPQSKLSLGLCVVVGRHVDGARDDHLPEDVAFDERPTREPRRQRSADRRLACGLGADDDHRARHRLHAPSIAHT
jgi:hypothetical protein